MIELKNKYVIGTHVMFYEIDIINEHVQSINNALETVSNKQNVTVDLFFNISEYFEKVDTEQTSKEELIEKSINERFHQSENAAFQKPSSQNGFVRRRSYLKCTIVKS